MKKRVLIILLMVALSFPLLAGESIPPYHWVWNYLNYLKVAGYLPELDMTNGPTDREVIAGYLLHIDPEKIPEGSREWKMVRILFREFAEEIKEIGNSGGDRSREWLQKILERLQMAVLPETVRSRVRFGAFGMVTPRYKNEDVTTDFQFHTRLGLQFGKRFTLYNNMKVFNHLPKGYIGKTTRKLYAYTEQAYLQINGGIFRFKIGRDYLEVGPGRTGKLLMSANSRPFDMYHAQFGKRYFHFSFWGIMLDPRPIVQEELKQYAPIARRYLNGHRLSVNIKNRYFVGASEVMVYGGPNANWDLAFMNPFTIYYGHQANGPYAPGNVLYSLDWDLYLPHQVELYGEFLVDDFQVDKKVPGDLEPNELGLLVGVNWANPLRWATSMLGTEYVQIRNRTYNAPVNDWEKYLHRNQVIGYYLGNDFKRWSIQLEKWVHPDLSVKGFAHLIRKGEGTVEGEFNTDYMNYTVEEGYHEPFPWGIVERHWQWGVALFYRPHPLANITLNIAYNDFHNYQHVTGATHSEISASVNLWLQWDTVFRTSRLEIDRWQLEFDNPDSEEEK